VHSGISWSAITQAESGRRRNLRPRTLSQLSAALGVSMDYLVDGGPTTAMLTHQALLYEDEEEFAERAASFLLDGIERSEAALAMTGKRNLKVLKKRLGPLAARIELIDSGRGYPRPDAPLELFVRFLTERLRDGAVWVRIVGEPPWAGRSAAEARRWAQYESLINLIFAGSPMTILCPYDVSALPARIVSEAHATHPQTIRAGEVAESPEYREPGSFVLNP
jgi:transcriptional regulator with XRE-family HTH domain